MNKNDLLEKVILKKNVILKFEVDAFNYRIFAFMNDIYLDVYCKSEWEQFNNLYAPLDFFELLIESTKDKKEKVQIKKFSDIVKKHMQIRNKKELI